MENSLSRQILLSILGIAILIVAVVGVSYAVFTSTISGEKINTLSSGTISMSYVEATNGISMVNAMPISDSEGKKLSGDNNTFDFVVSTTIAGKTTVNYEIVAEKIISDKEMLNDNDVRIYLERQVGDSYVPVLSGDVLSFVSNEEETDDLAPKMTLYRGSFTNESSKKSEFSERFRLRMWLSEEAIIDDISRSFQIRINVNGNV